MVLIFSGKSSDSLRRSLKSIVKKFFPQKDLIVYFKRGRRVANFFQVKDVTPVSLRSYVVYEFACASCHASYVGQTTRHLRRYLEDTSPEKTSTEETTRKKRQRKKRHKKRKKRHQYIT